MKKIGRSVLPLAVWLAIWALAALAVGQELLLPGPVLVAHRLVALSGTAAFWQTAAATVLRVFLGMTAGVALGALLAALTTFLPLCDLILSPLIRVLRATPVASFILLVLIWTARGTVPILIAGLMVLPVVWQSVTLGLHSVDAQLLELCRAYRFPWHKTVRRLYLPTVHPHFVSGVQTALGLAWKAGISAEVLCQPRLAIGTQIFTAKAELEPANLFAWTVVVIIMSFIVEYGIKRVLGGRTGGN